MDPFKKNSTKISALFLVFFVKEYLALFPKLTEQSDHLEHFFTTGISRKKSENLYF